MTIHDEPESRPIEPLPYAPEQTHVRVYDLDIAVDDLPKMAKSSCNKCNGTGLITRVDLQKRLVCDCVAKAVARLRASHGAVEFKPSAAEAPKTKKLDAKRAAWASNQMKALGDALKAAQERHAVVLQERDTATEKKREEAKQARTEIDGFSKRLADQNDANAILERRIDDLEVSLKILRQERDIALSVVERLTSLQTQYVQTYENAAVEVARIQNSFAPRLSRAAHEVEKRQRRLNAHKIRWPESGSSDKP